MKIISFRAGEDIQRGLIEDGVVYTLEGDIFGGKTRRGEAVGELGDVKLLLPPVQPGKLVCVGRNYAAHAAEHDSEVPEEPLLFLKPPSAVIGHEAPIALPAVSECVDHEAELAVVIGKTARKVTRKEALDYVLGYTCANDVSARDLQRRDGQWTRAKGFDTFAPLGPCIETELDPGDLPITCRVSGEVRQEASTADMVFDVPTLIEYVTAIMTLEPGDVLLTGTPSGVGPLSPGDIVEVEVEGVGILRNPVRAAD